MSQSRSDQLDALVRLLPAWQISAIRVNEAVAERLGIAPSDLQCLFLLDREGPTSPGTIGRRVGLTSGAATRMVDRLIAARLVRRSADASDRRRAVVTITPAAARRLHALYDPLDDRLRDLLDALSTGSISQLRAFVEAALAVNAELEAGIRPTRGGAG